MTSPSDEDALRRLYLASAGDPIDDPAELDRLGARSLAGARGLPPRPDSPEVRIRMHGAGVPGHDLPVHTASVILDAFQGAVTAVGSALRRLKQAQLPSVEGRRPSTAEVTELRLQADVAPGSVVFFLSGPVEQTTGLELPGTVSTETFLDVTLRRLFALLDEAEAEADSADQISSLVDDLRILGADAAVHLNKLVKRTLQSEVDLDLGWRNADGRRARASLQRRGGLALQDAIDRSRVQVDEVTLVGTLHTVSDGSDLLRLELEDGKTVRIAVDAELGLTLGPLLGRRVEVVAERTTTRNITTGGTTTAYHVIRAEEAPSTGGQLA